MIRFPCPHCGKSIKTSETLAGKSCKCPGCQGPLVVPAATLDEPKPVATRPPLPTPLRNPEPAPHSIEPVNVYQPEVYEVRRPTVIVNIPEAPRESRAAHSLGIASMVLGILAISIAWIPLLGMLGLPLSALGVLLGGTGLLVSLFRRGRGIGFAIAGTAICGLAVACALFVTVTVGKAVSAASKAIEAADNANSAIATAPPAETDAMSVADEANAEVVAKQRAREARKAAAEAHEAAINERMEAAQNRGRKRREDERQRNEAKLAEERHAAEERAEQARLERNAPLVWPKALQASEYDTLRAEIERCHAEWAVDPAACSSATLKSAREAIAALRKKLNAQVSSIPQQEWVNAGAFLRRQNDKFTGRVAPSPK